MTFYNSQIPQADDNPSVSQAQILSNFGKVNTDFNIDHVQFSASINSGFHRRLVFQDRLSSDPNLAANLAALYTKVVSGDTELFFQNNSTAADIFQLTNLPVISSGTNYSIVTPWGIKIQMGRSLSTTITYADAFPAGSVTYAISLTGITAVNPKVSTNSLTGLVYTVSSGVTANYFVMGSV